MALLRSIATVGGYTLASRVLGLARDMLLAHALGAGPVADAFLVAFRLPNLFRRLFAEGAFNAAFVPLFSRKLTEEGREPARMFAEEALAVMVVGLLALTILAPIAMPWLTYLLAGGFHDDPDKFRLAVELSILTFPYLLFISLTALQGGILNSLRRYAHAAAAPILLNVVLILSLAAIVPYSDLPGHVLGWSVSVAGICQFLWLAVACRRAGMALRLPWPLLTPMVRRLLRLMLPGVFSAGIMQVNLAIGTQIASWQDGAVSYLYYADRLYQLPLGLVGVATGVVLLPELARTLRGGTAEAAMALHNRALELALLLTVPAAAALIAIPGPIVSVIYEHRHGAFGPQAAHATAQALAAFAAGLPAYVLIKALAPGFYAREDTRTPFYFAVADAGANIAISLVLFHFFAFLGIAIATAIAAWLDAGLLAWRLHRVGHLVLDARLRRALPRILAASLAMALALAYATDLLQPALTGSEIVRIATLALLVVVGLALFGGLALVGGATNADELRRVLRRRPAERLP